MQGPSPKQRSNTFACLAGIHGNAQALRLVLEDLERREIHIIYAVGDMLFGGDEPLEVWRLLMAAQARCIRGWSDTALAELNPDEMLPQDEKETERLALFTKTRDALGELVLRHIAKMPTSLRVALEDGNEALIVFGSPASSLIAIEHDFTEEELLASLGDDPADLIICAGAHVPFLREAANVRFVGLGSVGDAPEGRVAHYTLVHPAGEGTWVEDCFLEY